MAMFNHRYAIDYLQAKLIQLLGAYNKTTRLSLNNSQIINRKSHEGYSWLFL